MESSVENLPIDIQYNKLLDWLVNRRHCIQEWQPQVAKIREKINVAVEDMPAIEEITSLIEGSHINYFHCLKIVEIMKDDTDSGKKNIFGQYSSKKMKDWMEIIKLYEKDGIYLAETAQMLTRNVNYEVTALKKQIAKCQQTQKDCDRKEAEYAAKAVELRKKYDTTCKQMGIEGKKIKSELVALLSDLPDVFSKIAKSTDSLQDAVTFYGNFVNFIMNSNELSDTCVPVLKYVQKNGNTTTYEWRTGTKPDKIDETAVVIDVSDEKDVTDNLDAIDWGDIGSSGDNLAESAIDFGEDIDFDIGDITIETTGVGEGGDNQDSANLSMVEHSGEDNGIDWSDTVIVEKHKPDSGEGVAKGEDALSILDNPKTRNLFIDDLMELEAFLTQRLAEVQKSTDGDIISTSQFQNAPTSVQIDTATLKSMIKKVRDISDQFTTVKMQHLMLIRNSPRYVDRLKETMKQTLNLADKMIFYEKDMVNRHKQSVEEQKELEPKLDIVVLRTKEMQKQMESEISKKYKNRPVNIMGEINLI